MKKYICMLTLAALLCGCGAEGSSEGEASVPQTDASSAAVQQEDSAVGKEIDLTAASDDLLKGDSDLTKAVLFDDKIFEQSCKNLYGFEKSELADALVLYNAGGGKANEVSILLRADGDTDAAIAALTERRDQRYSDFDGYVPEELPKIEAAKIFAIDGYAVLIISEESDPIEAMLREIL